MINDDFFDIKGLAEGAPLKERMIEYNNKSYTCQALKLTLKIDAYGEVYPCCFLFDDNFAKSSFRENYILGSLKTKGGIVMPIENDIQNNILFNIWKNNELLNKLRKKHLPIDREACNCCIRHFYQNEYLNILWDLFTNYQKYGILEYIKEKNVNEIEKINCWI